MDIKELQAGVAQYIARGQEIAPRLAESVKTGKLALQELLFVTTCYLGAFGLVSLLTPSLATTFYGGDDAYYSNDWAKFGAISNLTLALLSALASRWDAAAPHSLDVLRAFAFFFALNTVFNFVTVLYGALSFLCLFNAVIDAGLAYFYANHAGLLPHPRAQ